MSSIKSGWAASEHSGDLLAGIVVSVVDELKLTFDEILKVMSFTALDDGIPECLLEAFPVATSHSDSV